jgi:aspartyl protease family protein
VTDTPAAAPPEAARRPPTPAPARRRTALLRLLWVAVAAIAVALIINGWWNASSDGSRDLAQLGTLLLVLLFVGTALLGRRLRAGEIVRSLIGWSLVILIAAGGYAYRSEIAAVGGRVLAAFAPGVPIAGRLVGETNATSVVVMRARDGQFAVRARVDDAPLTMLIDTGASFVTLTLADAVGAGIDIRTLAFTVPIRTANGLIRAAPVTIRRLIVGTIERGNIPALVAPPDSLTESLLGMSFLETLGGYAISGDRLVLTN